MKYSLRLFVCTMIMLFAASGMPATAKTRLFQHALRNQTASAKVDQWLQQSGLTYKRTSDTTWAISQPRKDNSNLQILVAAGSDYVIVGVVVAVKKNMKVTSDLMLKLLHLSNTVDWVKIGFDNDEDLFVRTEVRTKLLDAQEFKINVENVVSASEIVYGEIKPFLVTP